MSSSSSSLSSSSSSSLCCVVVVMCVVLFFLPVMFASCNSTWRRRGTIFVNESSIEKKDFQSSEDPTEDYERYNTFELILLLL